MRFGQPSERLHELAAESQFQIWKTSQIGNGLDPQLLGLLAPHSQRVGVVESEWLTHLESHRLQLPAQLLIIAQVQVGEDFFPQGAGVVRVNIDLTVLQRLENQLRAAQLLIVNGRGVGADGQLLDHFAQQYRFGEFLRANLQARRSTGQGHKGQDDAQQGENQPPHHFPPAGNAERWALMKRWTNSSLG